jgi:hypothetical protein
LHLFAFLALVEWTIRGNSRERSCSVAFYWVLVIGTTIWVAFDSSSLGATKGTVRGLADMGPVGWSISCLACWIVAFPLYFVTRPKLIAAKAAREGQNDQQVGAPTGPQGPGWQSDPTLRHQFRYWNGSAWTAQVTTNGVPSTDPV